MLSPMGDRNILGGENTIGIVVWSLIVNSKLDSNFTTPTLVCIIPNLIAIHDLGPSPASELFLLIIILMIKEILIKSYQMPKKYMAVVL